MQKVMAILFFIFFVTGCSAPKQELSVYKGSCHIVGSDVYFSYNGESHIAKNQQANYQTLLTKNNATESIPVIVMDNGSYMILNN
jgi:hypothetical protein